MDTAETVNKVVEEKFSLDDLIPQDAELAIGEKVYQLRKVNLYDEAWLKQFGNIQKRMAVEDVDFMAKFTFRQLKDPTDFLPIDAEGYDDNGEKMKIRKTGPMRILEAMSGAKARYDWMQTLCVLFGISRPIFDQMVEESLKKNVSPAASHAGDISST